ncbi:MAG: hypothetical protein D8M58_05300 [Calditrichaeota bacterium]|nr:MAG: hypothetical protein DWQ03_21205 [Calditrichota bacterium]MBL1204791.1 hypothetical protein [Calditrichota bacterium]NOG44620.1 hypothetical protein [Calditrichota bacterium]
MLNKIVFFFLWIGFTNLFAQEREVKIIEVLDANLFLTEDSLQIKMVNLNVPSINDLDSARSELAANIIKFARIQLEKRTSGFIPSYKNSCSDNSIQCGHLFRKYPLGDRNINTTYLENGYAVYLPCDTLFMDEYREASERAIKNKKGTWALTRIARKPNYFNRFRATNWQHSSFYENSRDSFFPIIGFNYRWSELYNLAEFNSSKINISAEAGTFLYFMLPYANIGSEIRFKRFYIRGHYDVLLPFFYFVPSDRFESFDFYGLDVGVMIPMFKRVAWSWN